MSLRTRACSRPWSAQYFLFWALVTWVISQMFGIVLPHLAGDLAVEFGNAVGDAGEAERGERVVELIAVDAGDFADFLLRDAAEEREIAEQVEAVFFISRFLRRVGGEDEALFHLLEAVVFFVKMERGGEAVGFVEMPDFGIHAEFVEQARAAGTEDDVLGDAAEVVVIVKPVGDGAGEAVVFLDVGAQEKHRHRAENVAGQEHRLDPHRVAVDGDGETDAGVLEEGVFLFPELHGELAILAAGLVVVAVGPEDADAAEVLLADPPPTRMCEPARKPRPPE